MASCPKKLVNEPSECVLDSLRGFVSVHPGLCLLEESRVVLRADYEEVKAAGKVTVLAGGGSGHEPAFVGLYLQDGGHVLKAN